MPRGRAPADSIAPILMIARLGRCSGLRAVFVSATGLSLVFLSIPEGGSCISTRRAGQNSPLRAGLDRLVYESWILRLEIADKYLDRICRLFRESGPMGNDPRMMWRYTTIGIEFVTAFLAGVAAGHYADVRFGGKLWTLVGAAVGFAAAMYLLLRSAKQFRKEWERKDEP